MTKRERYLSFVLRAIALRKWNNGALVEDVRKALARAETLGDNT